MNNKEQSSNLSAGAMHPDKISASKILEYLDINGCPGSIRPEVFDETDSTNRLCIEKAAAGEPEGYAAVAGMQTAGRGRLGRSFYSPADTGVYMSILLRPTEYRGSDVLKLTTMAAVAVCEAIELVSDRTAEIKWVNDIYINGRKVCGILCEASYGSMDDGSKEKDRRGKVRGSSSGEGIKAVTVGIGVNVYPPEEGFPDEISGKAGSVFGSSGREALACCFRECTRSRLAAEILNRFMHYYREGAASSYFNEYRKRSLAIGRDVEIIGTGYPRRARVIGVDDDCGLIVIYEDESRDVLNSGEVSILPLNQK